MSRNDRSINQMRRRLLAGLGAAMATSAVALPWPMRLAMGQTPRSLSDYKAVICIFLRGGNDGNDTIIPVDGAYQDYARVRGAIALPKEELARLNLANTERKLALNPALAPLQPLVDRGDVAWIANAGPLVAPISAEEVRNGRARMPSLLGSHPDQQRHVSGGVPGTFAQNSGWGGRTLEALPKDYVDALLSNLAANEHHWVMRGKYWAPTIAEDREYFNNINLREILQGESSLDFEAYRQAVRANSGGDDLSFAYRSSMGSVLDEVLELRRVLDTVPDDLAPPVPNEPEHSIGEQLRTATRTLWAGREAGIKRQMVNIDWGGFDTHAEQRGSSLEHQDGQLAALAHALVDLDKHLTKGGLHDQVVTMILSEFGRPLQPNSSGGTDHAWGNHFFVMGGPVKGNRLIGQMPELVLGGPDDMDYDGQGRWVPTINTDQISASVMEWFGLPRADFGQVFPYLDQFPNSTLDLF